MSGECLPCLLGLVLVADSLKIPVESLYLEAILGLRAAHYVSESARAQRYAYLVVVRNVCSGLESMGVMWHFLVHLRAPRST